MSKSISAIFLLCGFTLAASGQAQKPCPARADVTISPGKPTVYVTYEDVGEFKSGVERLAATDTLDERGSASSGGGRAFRLRLHNNTRWAIGFPTDSLYVGPKFTVALRLCDGAGALGLREGIEVNARYEVEVLPGHENVKRPRVINRIDVSSTSWLPPGGSVIFVVPREHLGDGLAIYVSFNYEWEEARKRGDEPQHRVYFNFWNLPENAR